MRLLIDDTLVTAPVVLPLGLRWLEPELEWEARPGLTASDLRSGDAALLPSAEISLLAETHVVAPDVAVVADGAGAVAMRVAVRPDEIETTPIWLRDVSSTAELLSRATLVPFYGIKPTGWVREASADAQVVIVEGVEALRLLEGGFSEDLTRAWFILTGEPAVTHLLAVPRETDPAPFVDALREAREAGHERRRELRGLVAEQHALDRERVFELFRTQRYELHEGDRRALLMLLQRGNKGSRYPYPWQIAYTDDAWAEPANPPAG